MGKVINFKKGTTKLPRFLIADNPMVESGEFILHLREPKLLIKVYNLTTFSYQEREEFVKNIPVGGTCEVFGDFYYFVPVEQYADFSNKPKEILETELIALMKRCADWFISYVFWEEKNNK
jgi:hypothetical protein